MGSCKARAKLKVTGQGKGPFLMTEARFSVACSGVCPPERNTTPARFLGTWAFRTSAVFFPTSSDEEGDSKFLPAITMFTLRMQARRLTPILFSSSKSLSSILPVISADFSIL